MAIHQVSRLLYYVWIMKKNQKNVGNGLRLLESLPANKTPVVFFDPQYRQILDRMKYGNKKDLRMAARHALPQMKNELISEFEDHIERILRPSGHLFKWVDKFIICDERVKIPGLQCVDLITWEKRRIGMGYRTRRKCEYLLVFQKPPLRAKDKWKDHGIPDVWTKDMEINERMRLVDYFTNPPDFSHPHSKPEGLQRRLIEATTRKGDIVVDPCAGGYSVMKASLVSGRNYIGCDVRKHP